MSDRPRFVVLPLDDDRAPEWARADFGWFVYDRKHNAYVGDDQSEPEDKLLVRSGFSWVEQALNDVDSEAEATIADLRDRLRVMAPWVCRGCGCAAEEANDYDEVMGYCPDCDSAAGLLSDCEEDAAACVSVGMRALCGRRILEGC